MICSFGLVLNDDNAPNKASHPITGISMHWTAGTLRVFELVLNDGSFPFRELALPGTRQQPCTGNEPVQGLKKQHVRRGALRSILQRVVPAELLS